ncbi:MAG TPA: hypothetical protein VEQ66_05225 [Propionibacteriaceae bacterium]|nr:hypothetical protein [Propionibacteriaceae bacterium]
MTVKGWWSKSRGLPAADYASWSSSLVAQSSRPLRILAWASTPEGFAVASPSVLSYSAAGEAGDDWVHLGWHEIERGGWDADSSRLGWVRYGGERGGVELREPGRLPEVFRERVAASIVLEDSVAILGRQVLVVARRDLAEGDQPITWHSTLGRGLSWRTEGVQAAVDEAVARVRTEYNLG